MARDPRVTLFDGERIEVTGGYTPVNADQKGPAASQTNATQGAFGLKTAGPSSIMSPDLYDNNSNSFDHSYTVTTLAGRGNGDGEFVSENRILKDIAGENSWYDVSGMSKNPSTSNIIEWSQKNKHKTNPYKFTDFVFCKYWNKIPNNQMITLRRFAYPVWDNLKFPGQDAPDSQNKIYHPIAQAITYMGEGTGNTISNLISFTAKMTWGDVEGKEHDIDPVDGSLPGTGGISKMLGFLTGDVNLDAIAGKELDPYKTGPYANKIYGPINRITSVKRREAGLSFTHTFTLEFKYVARPIDGVNTKAVMLDIIANMLLLTYADAAFWGGEHRFFANKSGFPFLGGAAGLQKFRDGDPVGFLEEVRGQFSKAGETISALFGDLFGGDPISALKNIAGGAVKVGMAQALGKTSLALAQGLPALLTGSPVGEWHVVIGNPLNPIVMIGNLICTGVDFEFGDILGADDFPTEMTVKISMEHGMERDRAAIESMFNRGTGKIYALPDKLQKLLDNTSGGVNASETGVDKYTGGSTSGGSNVGRGYSLNGNESVVEQGSSFFASTGKDIAASSKVIVRMAMGKNNEE